MDVDRALYIPPKCRLQEVVYIVMGDLRDKWRSGKVQVYSHLKAEALFNVEYSPKAGSDLFQGTRAKSTHMY